MKITKQAQKETADYLKSLLKPGDTVYTVLRSVSRSGMLRSISLKIIRTDGARPYLMDITGYAGDLLEYSRGKDGGLRVSGCGMDMGFHVVYNLSRVLFGIADKGGYALQQEWV
jgi:hypothetical protein